MIGFRRSLKNHDTFNKKKAKIKFDKKSFNFVGDFSRTIISGAQVKVVQDEVQQLQSREENIGAVIQVASKQNSLTDANSKWKYITPDDGI